MRSARADSSLFPLEATGPDDMHERALLAKGFATIAGVDEAGRGPLAGPVVAAAVVLDLDNVPAGLNDSKKLTAKQREALFDVILHSARAVSVVSINAETIDKINILEATMLAMRNAICRLALDADHVLIDGNQQPSHLPCPATTLVKGDQRSVSIAAASIIAKVTRDRMMVNAGLEHPDYGFESHKGYGSAVRHTDAISKNGGVVRLHRFSFAPLKNKKPPEGDL
jgi:ribonuclease HII